MYLRLYKEKINISSIMSLYSHLKNQPETIRVGLKWSKEEDAKLMKQVYDGIKLDVITKNHQRTINGVKSRIMLNALNVMKEKELSLEEVSKLVNISIVDLNNFKQNQDTKKEKITKKEEVKKKKVTKITIENEIKDNLSHPDILIILKEIRDYLKIIAEK